MSTPSSIKTISSMLPERSQVDNFSAIRLRIASPDKISEWSHGEVLKPETINYRTQKPERDGLFCEKIFGPVKDWECACGKYKKIRYKGIVCDKCGVEVTRSLVRRERMGHIALSTPCSHIWFLRGVPSKIGFILGLSASALEKIIYFASFIITKVDEDLKKQILEQARAEYKSKKKNLSVEFEKQKSILYSSEKSAQEKDKEFVTLSDSHNKKLDELDQAILTIKKELDEIKPLQIIPEHQYHEYSLKYGHIFEAGIGAESIRQLLEQVNLEEVAKDIEKQIKILEERGSLGQISKLTRRLKLIKTLIVNKIRPEWMILSNIPIIPPDLRPMVQLDGGRFASSDLNDLYRRVINRNNRLKKLVDLNAPEVIRRNEKRMLQEAVDALIDNSARHGKTVTASTGQKRQLKSIADILKGKQGRFRQNLLGKRVDYSGRSVIIVGPHLKLHQVGLPKIMAIELFKPFVICKLIKRGHVHNVRSASRLIEEGPKEVWDILEEVTKKATVMINRAPTLHRLSIQSFKPVLIEGKAIQIHPLVCPAFNADFDGDQMAVHVPITEEAKKESSNLMLSVNNLLKPATGEPVTTPDKDMIWGCYFMTLMKDGSDDQIKFLSSEKEVSLAIETGKIQLSQKIKVKINNKIIETTPGRVVFNSILPKELRDYDQLMDKKAMKKTISDSLDLFGPRKTAKVLDAIKDISFEYMTTSGASWGMADLPDLPTRDSLIKETEEQAEIIEEQYEAGFLTDEERHIKIIELWVAVKDKIVELSKNGLDKHGSVYSMVESGARGSWGQITQMMGMKGLVTNPQGEIIELPVKGNFKQGFNVLEYFIATHGARKGLADTALRTANAGYLTRRLVDVSNDVVITEKNCGDKKGIILTRAGSEEMGEELETRIIGRVLAEDIVNKKGKVIVKKGEFATKSIVAEIVKLKLDQVRVRSVINCKTVRGVCQKCYGYDLGRNQPVKLGTAVGIVAAQSIGEPGTQLTLKTFHTGGVAGKDITQGLPRVEEIFEARAIKRKAVIAEVSGKVKIVEKDGQRMIQLEYKEDKEDRYKIKKGYAINVQNGDVVELNDVIMERAKIKVKAKNKGVVKITDALVKVLVQGNAIKEYPLVRNDVLWIKDKDIVNAGDQLTEGSIDLHELYELKGSEAVQKYIIREIQFIYSSQGQKLNDKHIEVIARQMFSRCLITDPGDTNILSGEVMSKVYVNRINEDIIKTNKKPARAQELLLGITKVSLSVDSFLSAASFQETARVLIDAATNGRIDHLMGLKENVIIGRLIPVGTGFKEAGGSLPNRANLNLEEE